MPAATQFGTLLREIPNKFTHREQEIAALVAQGLTRREIAQRLGLSISTVSRHVRNILRKLEAKTPPLDPAFYERLWAVPGFEDVATLLAHISTHQAMFAKLSDNVLALFMPERDQALPEDLQAYAALLTKLTSEILAQLLVEAMRVYSGLGLAAIVRPTMHAPQAAPLPGEVEEAAPEHSAKSFTDNDEDDIIPPPMPPKEVEPGDHLTKHVSDLQSQAKLGSETKQRPIPYPHENVVFHAAQLQAETLRRQRTKRDTVKSYEVVATLRDAAERAGVADGEILTTSEIEAEYSINRKLVHEYTKRGRRGRPHLTPLSVRLGGERGGSAQLLFRRGYIERIVANPPKTGRPRKAEVLKPVPSQRLERLEQQSTESSERLMTLAEASEISGIRIGTLSNYLHEGKLTRRGRQRYPAPGGGKVLVDLDEVRSLQKRPVGRPRKNPATGNNS